MIDAVDEFWLQNMGKYKDKEFKSITKGKIDLSNFESINYNPLISHSLF